MKIVIFDMDGTLLDSKKDITISVNYVRNTQYNLPPLCEEFIVECINMDVRNLPKLFYETEVYEKNDKDMFEKHYAYQCTKNHYLYDGIKDILEILVESGVKVSVATNAPTKFAKEMLKSLKVDTIFDMIVGADEVECSKPSPEMIEKILNFYNFDDKKDTALMIGDNTKDMLSAKNANIDAVFATWGFSPTTQYAKIISHPKEILDIVL